MIFNDEVAFLHVPKMGGMSVTRYLLNNLAGEIHLVVPESAFDHARAGIEFADVAPRLHLHAGIRHENMSQAAALLATLGVRMDAFRTVMAVIRNPYTLEQSYFQHLRKASTGKFRLARGGRPQLDMQLAQGGDFRAFCQRAPFYGHLPSRIERYYTLDGRATPANLQVLRFEQLQEDLARALQGRTLGRSELRHLNASTRGTPKDDAVDMRFDAGAEEAVFRKFEFLFNFYPRASSPEWAGRTPGESGAQAHPSLPGVAEGAPR